MSKQASDILYYALTPVRPAPDGAIMSAAIQRCMATGKTLDGMGGGSLALSLEVVDALDMWKHGGETRVIGSARDWDDLLALARDLAKSGPTGAIELAERAKDLVDRISEQKI
jgi:hypothetical protein